MSKFTGSVIAFLVVGLLGIGASRWSDRAQADEPFAKGIVNGEKKDGAKKDGEGAKKDGERKDGAKKDGERKDGAKKDGERKDGAKKDGERKDGAKKDGEGAKKDGAKKDGEVAKKDGEKGTAPREGDKTPEKTTGGKGEAVTATGLLAKESLKRKRDDGSELSITTYTLTEAKGNKIMLPAPRVAESGKVLDSFKLEEFVGKTVTVVGRGYTARTSEAADAPVRIVRMFMITDVKQK